MANVTIITPRVENADRALSDDGAAFSLLEARWTELLLWYAKAPANVPEIRGMIESWTEFRKRWNDSVEWFWRFRHPTAGFQPDRPVDELQGQALNLSTTEGFAGSHGYVVPAMRIDGDGKVQRADVGAPTGASSPGPTTPHQTAKREAQGKGVTVVAPGTPSVETHHPIAVAIAEKAPHPPGEKDPYLVPKAIGVGALAAGTLAGASMAKGDATRVAVAVVGTVATAAAAWLGFRPSSARDPHIGRGGGGGGGRASGRTSGPIERNPAPAPAPIERNPAPAPSPIHRAPAPAPSHGAANAPDPRAPNKPRPSLVPHATTSTGAAPPPLASSAPPPSKSNAPPSSAPPSSAPAPPVQRTPTPRAGSWPSAPVSAPSAAPAGGAPPSRFSWPGFGPRPAFGARPGFGFAPGFGGVEVIEAIGGCPGGRVELVRQAHGSRLFRGPDDLVLEPPAEGCLLEERDGFARVRWDAGVTGLTAWVARSAIALIVGRARA